jgi:hypothetical protein
VDVADLERARANVTNTRLRTEEGLVRKHLQQYKLNSKWLLLGLRVRKLVYKIHLVSGCGLGGHICYLELITGGLQ